MLFSGILGFDTAEFAGLETVLLFDGFEITFLFSEEVAEFSDITVSISLSFLK